MPRFKRKPVVLEGYQFKGADYLKADAPDWIKAALEAGVLRWRTGANPAMVIDTMEGSLLVNHGDFIMKGTRGGLFPVTQAEHRDIYEEVPE